MPTPTLPEWIGIFLGSVIGRILLLIFPLLGNYLLLNILADAYLRHSGLMPLERPGYFDRAEGQKLWWRLLTLSVRPYMGVWLKTSIILNRLLTAAFILNFLTAFLPFR